jgi:hypothetical protein
VEGNCPKCGKPLLAQRDKTGIAVKAFDTDDPPYEQEAEQAKKCPLDTLVSHKTSLSQTDKPVNYDRTSNTVKKAG